MSKAIKVAIVAAVVTFAVVATGGAALGLAPIFTSGALAGLGIAMQYAIMTFATTLISAGIGMMTSKGVEANNANFGSKASTRGALNPRQIIYGETRVGSTITFLRTTGTDNNKLSMYLVFAGHEIESFESIFFNEIQLTTSSTTSSGAGSNNKIFIVTSIFSEATSAEPANTDSPDSFNSLAIFRSSTLVVILILPVEVL